MNVGHFLDNDPQTPPPSKRADHKFYWVFFKTKKKILREILFLYVRKIFVTFFFKILSRPISIKKKLYVLADFRRKKNSLRKKRFVKEKNFFEKMFENFSETNFVYIFFQFFFMGGGLRYLRQDRTLNQFFVYVIVWCRLISRETLFNFWLRLQLTDL